MICSRAAQAALKEHHPCPKPVEEMAWLIETLTEPGQIVLDCFCGLGSTLVATEQLGRRWIGCDKGRRYCQIAMKRLAELQTESKRTGADTVAGRELAEQGEGQTDYQAQIQELPVLDGARLVLAEQFAPGAAPPGRKDQICDWKQDQPDLVGHDQSWKQDHTLAEHD